MSLAHLSPYVRISKEKIRERTIEKWTEVGLSYTEEMLDEVVNKDLQQEVSDGIQTLQYQINTLNLLGL